MGGRGERGHQYDIRHLLITKEGRPPASSPPVWRCGQLKKLFLNSAEDAPLPPGCGGRLLASPQCPRTRYFHLRHVLGGPPTAGATAPAANEVMGMSPTSSKAYLCFPTREYLMRFPSGTATVRLHKHTHHARAGGSEFSDERPLLGYCSAR